MSPRPARPVASASVCGFAFALALAFISASGFAFAAESTGAEAPGVNTSATEPPAANPPAAKPPLEQAAATALSGEKILARAKAQFRAYRRPAFVSYTLSREDGISGRPYLADSYSLGVWCRTADRAALTRTVNDAGDVDGPLAFVRPAFDKAVDPGPPTIDIFERNAFLRAAAPVATPAADIPTLAVVAVRIELDYRVDAFQLEGNAWVLHLSPRREPERNRLRTLWIDHESFDLRRAIATDALFLGDQKSAEIFDMKFEKQNGIPVIRSIEMRSADEAPLLPQILRHRGLYLFQNIAFADAMPAWYFNPARYASNVRQAPH
jgi:hypothetical protein